MRRIRKTVEITFRDRPKALDQRKLLPHVFLP